MHPASRACLSLALLAPIAAATPATEPYAFDASVDAEPWVGRAVTLTIAIEARRPLDAPVRLEVPEWIEVEEPREWHARAAEGERVERAWRLTATRAGFWHAGLAVDAPRARAYGDPVDPSRDWQPVGGCCLYAWSTQGRGMAGAEPVAAVPGESAVGFHPSFRALDAERAQLLLRVSPQDSRFAGQELVFHGSMGGGEEQTAPADAPHEFAHVFPLADGERAVLSPSASVRIRFEQGADGAPPSPWSLHVACANIEVERAGDEVREAGRTGCIASSRPRAIPLAPVALAIALALALRRARA